MKLVRVHGGRRETRRHFRSGMRHYMVVSNSMVDMLTNNVHVYRTVQPFKG